MYLKKINIENFQSYYDKNSILIEKQLNLILGTIGSGKSKLFNAFYWNFFGDIYKYQDGWLPVSYSNFLSIFNKKALKEAEIDDIIKAKVVLHIHNEKSYIVSRCIQIKKVNGNNPYDEVNWKYIQEELIISFDNSEGNRVNIDNFLEAQNYIDKKILPKDISRYIWFQGETLNELINLKNGKSFKDAVNFISYIGYYDRNIKITQELITDIGKNLRKEKRKNTSNEKEFNRVTKEIENIEKDINANKEILDNAHKELSAITNIIDNIDKRLDDINEFVELKTKKELLEKDLKGISTEIENINKNLGNLFSKEWILLGTDSILNKGFDKLHAYQKWFEENQNNNPTGLPYHIPDPAYLLEMLDKKICYVCGEKFTKDSNAYKHIENRHKNATDELEKIRQKKSSQLNVFEKATDLLSSKTSIMSHVENLKYDITNHFKNNKELNQQKIEIEEEIKNINDEITLIQEKHGNQMTQNFREEKNKYNYNIDEREVLNNKIKDIDLNISNLKSNLKSKNIELNEIPTKIQSDYKEEKILIYLQSLSDLYVKVKNEEYNKLISKIEDKANELLIKITSANNVINGKIYIDRNNYTLKLIDLDDANSNRDINTGHITLMKMCIINAIVLISNEYKNKSYPFISDAPTSALDDGTTKLYYKVLNEEFEQSVIMTKDLFIYKDGKNVVDNDSLKEFNFNNVYLIEKKGVTNNLTESNSFSVLEKI